MIYKRVWEGFRNQIDIALISAAWPEFSCRETGRKHWLFGHVGPLSASIPAKASKDLGIPVVFANQCGETRTEIPYVGTWITDKIADRFAGKSCIVDGLHAAAVFGGVSDEIVLSEITIHPQKGPRSWRSTSRSASVAFSSDSAPAGSVSKPFGSIAARAVVAP
jgi:N-carbamoylputrescine amidase